MATRDILNFRAVGEEVLTGGQPTEEQLRAAAEEGVTTVINLATINPRYSLPDEEGVVRSLGMEYSHIPVEWEKPTTEDFERFESAMEEARGKTLIHCAANYRVTAFYGLYAMKHLGWSEAQADALRASVWAGSDYPIWEQFVREMKGRMM